LCVYFTKMGNSIIKTYKPLLIFTATFAGVYALLTGIYIWFLSLYPHQTDPLTRFVGKSVDTIFNYTGIDAATPPISNGQGVKLLINGQYVARIVEGCTAASIIIMFIAFIIAFGHNPKKSFLFALIGSLLIFIFNIIRIAFLGYLLYAFPAYQDIAHRIIFPALIYGFVVILWIIFIKKYNNASA